MMRFCKDCKFFDLSTFEPGDRESWCNRFPPMTYVGPTFAEMRRAMDTPDDQSTPNYPEFWEHPCVGVLDSCGEWEPREETEDDSTHETCRAVETETVRCIGTDVMHYGRMVDVYVMECDQCGGTYEYVHGNYEFCPRCGRRLEER